MRQTKGSTVNAVADPFNEIQGIGLEWITGARSTSGKRSFHCSTIVAVSMPFVKTIETKRNEEEKISTMQKEDQNGIGSRMKANIIEREVQYSVSVQPALYYIIVQYRHITGPMYGKSHNNDVMVCSWLVLRWFQQSYLGMTLGVIYPLWSYVRNSSISTRPFFVFFFLLLLFLSGDVSFIVGKFLNLCLFCLPTSSIAVADFIESVSGRLTCRERSDNSDRSNLTAF